MPAVKSQVSQVLTTCSTLKGSVLADECHRQLCVGLSI